MQQTVLNHFLSEAEGEGDVRMSVRISSLMSYQRPGDLMKDEMRLVRKRHMFVRSAATN